jgi:hypothetical protein
MRPALKSNLTKAVFLPPLANAIFSHTLVRSMVKSSSASRLRDSGRAINISPATDVANFYSLNCKLALFKSYHDHDRLWQADPSQTSSSLRQAIISRGCEWEDTLVKRLTEENLILTFSEDTPFLSQIENDPRAHFFVIGAKFRDPDLFREEYHSRGTFVVAWGTFKPDFIEIWKKIEDGNLVVEWRVIDAKSSKFMKVNYPLKMFSF